MLIWFDSIPSIFTGSRACSLKGWKSLKVGWDPAQFEPDAMTCVIYVILQMPCIIFTVPHTISTISVEKGFDLDVKPMNLVHAHPET